MDVLTGLPLVKKRCRSWLFLWQVSSHSPTHTMLSWSLVVSSLVRKQLRLCIPQMLPTSIFPPASCSQSPQGSRHLVNWIFSVSPGAEAVLVAGGVGRASWCPTQKASLVAARSTRQSSTLLQPSVWRQRSHWTQHSKLGHYSEKAGKVREAGRKEQAACCTCMKQSHWWKYWLSMSLSLAKYTPSTAFV